MKFRTTRRSQGRMPPPPPGQTCTMWGKYTECAPPWEGAPFARRLPEAFCAGSFPRYSGWGGPPGGDAVVELAGSEGQATPRRARVPAAATGSPERPLRSRWQARRVGLCFLGGAAGRWPKGVIAFLQWRRCVPTGIYPRPRPPPRPQPGGSDSGGGKRTETLMTEAVLCSHVFREMPL